MCPVDQFKELWQSCDPDEKRQIFDIVWKDAEEACTNAGKLPPCPYKRIISLYHEMLPELPKVAVLSETRKRHIKARWRLYPSISYWVQYFERVRESAFLMGKAPTTQDRRPFVADIDWLINEANMTKVIEGKYQR